VRPDLSAFFVTLLRSLDVGVLRSFTTLCFALDDKEMNSRAKRCALLGGLFRPPWKSVKKFLLFSVKKKKLFERSEFFFFRKRVKILALERQPALFLFVSFSFVRTKGKRKTLLNRRKIES
jgi:hypothetical protein